MKVGIVSPYDWSHPGGVRSHILGLQGALGRRGIRAEVIAPASRREADIWSVGRTVGIPANGSRARICLSPSARRRLRERLLMGDLDLLHLHEPAVPSVSLLALTVTQLPVAATFHAAARRSTAYWLARPLLGHLFARIGQRMAVSEEARALVARYLPGEYRIVPNGVDFPRFAGAEPDPELLDHKPFVLFVGRPEPRKGFEVVRRAVEALRPKMKLRLVAAGLPASAGPDWVVPLGMVSHDRLPAIYAAADVFCAPNLRGESFGIVLLEAMAAGAPVVASDLPGFREAAGPAALFFPPADHRALADRLEELLGDPARAGKLSRLGRRRAEAYDW
ncbi:MAG: glycosyltransferase family 4 protein, partial [Acidimicrobiales bacterium]